MLSMRPCQRCTKPAVNSRMKPPRQIRSTRFSSSTACSVVSKPARSLPNGALSMVTAGMPSAPAFASPAASALLEMTTTISAGKSCARAAPISAVMFDPRPEIRMATRRFMASPCEIEMAVIDHAVFACGGNDLAQQRCGFAGAPDHVHHLVDRAGFGDDDHADAAVEGAQQFQFCDAALFGQPFEYRQHRQARQIDAYAEMPRQHARDVVGKTAAGDVRQPLDRAGFADRTEAGF